MITMSNVQIVAAYAASVITPFAGLMLLQWLLNRRDDRQIQREMDKARHPSMRMRSDVRILHLTVDDFNGCDDCFTGWHGIKTDDGRCLCCGFDLPASYELSFNGPTDNYRRV